MNSSSRLSDKVAGYIRSHSLLPRGAKVVVALSGGADSVALLALLLDLGYDCVAAHCNFHLRGEESNRDCRFVQQLCVRLKVDLTVRDFDVAARMEATGESCEMACRTLRYEWFDSLLDRERAKAIAVGHHREDNVETFMINLLRGTGPAGLCGMKPRNGYVVRPLLECSRPEIEEFMHERCLEYVTDSTNAANDFRRNRLRNIVLPQLTEQFGPQATDAILRTMAQTAMNQELYRELVAARAGDYTSADGSIDLGRLARSEKHAAMLLYEMLHSRYGFNMATVDDILSQPEGSGRRFFSASDVELELDRGILSVVKTGAAGRQETAVRLDRDILTPLHISIERKPVSAFKPGRCPDEIYLDAAILDSPGTVVLRRWRRGDRLEPYGMKGSRLVSDLFTDAKYSAAQKRSAWLLCKGDKVLWVCGLRASRHFAVGPGAKEFLTLKI